MTNDADTREPHHVVVDGTVVTCTCDWLFLIDTRHHTHEYVFDTIIRHTMERALAAGQTNATGEVRIINDPFVVNRPQTARLNDPPLNCGYCGVPETGDYVHVPPCPRYRKPTIRQRIRRWFSK